MRLLVLLIFTICYSEFAFSRTALVHQREYIKTSKKMHDFIITRGLSTCVGVLISSKSEDSVVLAHIDSRVNLEKEIYKLVSSFNSKEILVRLIGGYESSYDLHFEIKKQLNSYSQVRILDSIYNDDGDVIDIMFDLSQEALVMGSNIEKSANVDYRVYNAKHSRLKFGRHLYRHEESIGGGDYVELKSESSGAFFGLGTF